jgi:hypothetical protein
MIKETITKKFIVIKTSFIATHRWALCPPEAYAPYLRTQHRHQFHVIMKWPVLGSDRELEFLEMKAQVDAHLIKEYLYQDLGSLSCEMIAERLIYKFNDSHCCFVSVFEDNENGAEVTNEDYYN